MRVLAYEFKRGDVLSHDPIKILKKIAREEVGVLMLTVALSEYPEVVLSIYEGRCPFCGFKPRRRLYLWNHIRRNKCRYLAVSTALDILGKYREFKKRVDIRIYNGRARYCLTGSTWFYDPFELYRFYKKVVGNGGSI